MAFAREGAKVAVQTADRDGLETVALIREGGGEAVFFPADVSKEEQVQSALAQASEALGGIDVLHCNAGMAVRNKVPNRMQKAGNRCIEVNLRGVFLCAKYAIPYMLDKGGSIVHTFLRDRNRGCAESSGVQRFQRRDRGADPEHGRSTMPNIAFA